MIIILPSISEEEEEHDAGTGISIWLSHSTQHHFESIEKRRSSLRWRFTEMHFTMRECFEESQRTNRTWFRTRSIKGLWIEDESKMNHRWITMRHETGMNLQFQVLTVSKCWRFEKMPTLFWVDFQIFASQRQPKWNQYLLLPVMEITLLHER